MGRSPQSAPLRVMHHRIARCWQAAVVVAILAVAGSAHSADAPPFFTKSLSAGAERPREAFAAEDISVASSFFIALFATLPCSSYATAREDFAFASTFLTSCFLNTIASPVSTERGRNARSVGHCQARSQATGPPRAQSTNTSLGSNEPSQPSRASTHAECGRSLSKRSVAHKIRLTQRLIRRSRFR